MTAVVITLQDRLDAKTDDNTVLTHTVAGRKAPFLQRSGHGRMSMKDGSNSKAYLESSAYVRAEGMDGVCSWKNRRDVCEA